MAESLLKAVGMVPVKELEARDNICNAIPVDEVDNCRSFAPPFLLFCVREEGATLVLPRGELVVVLVAVVEAVVMAVVMEGNGPPSRLLLRSSVCNVLA